MAKGTQKTNPSSFSSTPVVKKISSNYSNITLPVQETPITTSSSHENTFWQQLVIDKKRCKETEYVHPTLITPLTFKEHNSSRTIPIVAERYKRAESPLPVILQPPPFLSSNFDDTSPLSPEETTSEVEPYKKVESLQHVLLQPPLFTSFNTEMVDPLPPPLILLEEKVPDPERYKKVESPRPVILQPPPLTSFKKEIAIPPLSQKEEKVPDPERYKKVESPRPVILQPIAFKTIHSENDSSSQKEEVKDLVQEVVPQEPVQAIQLPNLLEEQAVPLPAFMLPRKIPPSEKTLPVVNNVATPIQPPLYMKTTAPSNEEPVLENEVLPVTIEKPIWRSFKIEKVDTEDPLVSIIVPMYNMEKYVTGAVDNLLEQTYKHIEILLIDDSSTDQTHAIATSLCQRSPKIHVYQNEKTYGTNISINLGLRNAKGEYLTIFAVTERILPTKIKEQVSHLNENPLSVATLCHSSLIHKDSGQLMKKEIGAHTIMFRNYVLDTIGYYDSTRYSAYQEFVERMEKVYGKPFLHRSSKVLSVKKDDERKEVIYLTKARQWHETNIPLYMPFPLKKRPFSLR